MLWIDPLAPYWVQVVQAHLQAVVVGFALMAVALIVVLVSWAVGDLAWRFVSWLQWRGTVAHKLREQDQRRRERRP